MLFDFQSSLDDELSCMQDDHLIVLKANMERNWCKALLHKKVGLVPKTYVRLRPIPGFLASTSRSRAEDILSRNAIDNSFLVRESETCPGDFSLSVFHKGSVKHAMISKDAELKFRVYERMFSSVNALVEYHKDSTISRTESIKLVHPVPESLVFVVDENFTARDDKELTLETGKNVVVTDYLDRNWWHGTCGKREGTFPVRFIKPVNYPTIFDDNVLQIGKH